MSRYGLAGWRKAKAWRRKLKTQMIGLTRLASGGGPAASSGWFRFKKSPQQGTAATHRGKPVNSYYTIP